MSSKRRHLQSHAVWKRASIARDTGRKGPNKLQTNSTFGYLLRVIESRRVLYLDDRGYPVVKQLAAVFSSKKQAQNFLDNSLITSNNLEIVPTRLRTVNVGNQTLKLPV